MRVPAVLLILILVPLNPLLLDEEDSIGFFSSAIESWTVSTSPENSNCSAMVISAWKPAQNWDEAIQADNSDGDYVFSGLNGGNVHLAVDCEDGTFNRTWATAPELGGITEVVLEHSWNGAPINVSGAASMKWWNSNGSISLESESIPTIAGQNGWLLVKSSNASLLTDSDNVSIDDLGTTNISVQHNTTTSLRFIHANSGHVEYVFSENGYLNTSLPLLDDGHEWHVYVGSESMTYHDDEGLVSWLNNTTSSFDPGLAVLQFSEPPVSGMDLQLNWSAEHRFGSEISSSLLPGWGLPLQMQIDLYLDGSKDAFIERLNNMKWFTGVEGMCCAIDNIEMFSLNGIGIDGFIADNGTWGWNESGVLNAQRNHNPLAVLTLLLDDDPRQLTPLRVDVPTPWEFRSSSKNDWVSGEPTSFTTSRDQTGVSGGFAITIGQNTAPSVSSDSGGIKPYDTTFSIDASASFDHGIGELDCQWELIGQDGISHTFDETIVEVNASTIDGWNHGDEISMNMTCTDHHGVEGIWQGSMILDGDDPVLNSVRANVSCDGSEIAEFDILNCAEIAIPAGQRIWLTSSVSDEISTGLSIRWYSNKSIDWNDGGVVTSIVFHQGGGVNQASMDIEERQIARNTTHRSLQVVVTDQAGHNVSHSWNVEVLDGTSPHIKPKVWIDEEGMMSGLTQPRVGDSLYLDLSESFDDLSAASEIRFTIEVDGEVLTDRSNVSWQTAGNTSLPEMGLGIHNVTITAWDEAGNTGQYKVEVQIHPLDVVDFSVVDVSAPKDGVQPGDHEVKVLVRNKGAKGGWMRICLGQDCIDRAMPIATPYGPGEDEITLFWHAEDNEVLNILVEWENSTGVWKSSVIKTGVMADEPWSTVETLSFWMFALVALGVIIVMLRRSSD